MNAEPLNLCEHKGAEMKVKVLAGDIGGTKTRLAVFDVDGTHLETVTERS
jgi:glucokinase